MRVFSITTAYCWLLIFGSVIGKPRTQAKKKGSSSSHQGILSSWSDYKAEFGKNYSFIEDPVRMAQFLVTDALIKANNFANPLFTMGHNEFSDMFSPERNQYRGVIVPAYIQALITSVTTPLTGGIIGPQWAFLNPIIDFLSRSLPPDSLDLRNDACVGPIKNQRSCSSCWAFAAIAPVEYTHCKKKGAYVALSEQQLIDCDFLDQGCIGGWPAHAMASMILTGVSTQESYPYTGQKSYLCDYLKAFVSVESRPWLIGYVATEPLMMAALDNYGPLAVTLYVDATFFYYKSGVYADIPCAVRLLSPNHAIVIVGYGRQDAFPFLSYWIGRNQWGTKWGMEGYIYILRGVNLCGIEQNAMFVISGY